MWCSCLETAYPRQVGSKWSQHELEMATGSDAAAHGRCILTFGTVEGLHGWGRCGFFSGIYQLSVDTLAETKGAETLGSNVVMVTIAGVMLQEEGAFCSTHSARLGATTMASLHGFSR